MSLARSLRAVPAALVGGIGLWLAIGVVAVPGPGERIGVLAPWWVLGALVGAPLLVAAWSEGGLRRTRGWLLGAVGFLPWLPVGGLPALLLWQGPLAIVLIASAIALIAWPVRIPRGICRAAALAPHRHTTAAVLIALACYLAAAWRMAPILPGGDEPHYLIITQSLLHDGDLAIENNHQGREYLAYIDQPLKPDYLRRGVDGAIYSIHAPGVPALVAPAFAIGGYPGVVTLLALLAALGAGLVWRASWHLTGSTAAAWIGWASVSLTAPFFFQAFTVYPDGPGGVLVMGAVYGLRRRRGEIREREAMACAGAIALLPWLHTRFAILAAVLGALWMLRLWQGSRSAVRLAAFAAVPAVSAVLWLSYFDALYGTPNPAAPYGGYTQSSLANAWRGLSGLSIDQQFGLVPNAPIYLAALAGFAWLWRVHRRLALELAVVVMPYAVAAASYHMWWGGRSAPARFLVPVLLPAGGAVALAWKRGGLATRALTMLLLVVSIALTAVLAVVDRGALVYNTRDGYALWLEWIAPLVRLPLAAPSLFRSNGDLAGAWLQALAWAAGGAAAWAIVRWIGPVRASGDALRRSHASPIPPVALARAGVVVGAAALGLMAGSTAGWMLARADAVDEGSGLWRVVRAAGRPGAVGLRLPAIAGSDAPGLVAGVPLPAPTPRGDRRPPLFTARDVPPGDYAVTEGAYVTGTGAIGGVVGRGLPPIATAELSAGRPVQPLLQLHLPFGATTLTIDRTAGASGRSGDVRLAPLQLTRTGVPLARAGVRFGQRVLWLLDDNAWAEPGGLWTRGTNATRLAVDGSGPVRLRVRNGPLPNEAAIAAGPWRATVRLAAGEAKDVDVPVPAAQAPIAIEAARAFRPADHDARSGDARRLGVWVEVR